MQQYCDDNGLALNTSKTELIVFSLRDLNRGLMVKLINKTIEQKSVAKFLGICFDEHLSWSPHIDHMLKKLAVHCYVIWQLRSKLSLDLLKLYYFAYVQSCLGYGILCWGSATRVPELLIAQKKIIRTMTFKCRRFSCRDLFKELKILTLPSLFILHSVDHVRSNPVEYVVARDGCINYDLRHNLMVSIPYHRLSVIADSPLVLPVKLFNKLPMAVKQIQSKYKFKYSVKDLLLKHSFYSVKEFLDCVSF